MIDIRFPTALQMMLTLAYAKREGTAQLTSAQLANGLGSTSSLVRKLLVPLSRHELIRSSMGKAGGVRLARPASEIALSDIYAAVTGDKKLWSARRDVPHLCTVSSAVEEYFETLAADAETAVRAMLGARTLDQSLAELLALKAQAEVRVGAPGR